MRKTLSIAFLLFTVCATQAETPEMIAKKCHKVAQLASSFAKARQSGVSIAELIEAGQKESAKRGLTWNSRPLEAIAMDVFDLKLTPDEAYVVYRRRCEATPSK